MVNLDSPRGFDIREGIMTAAPKRVSAPQKRVPQVHSPSPREETRSLFRNAVLVAAEEVFAEKGFHGSRIQDIAERARVGVGTVYNHFAQKDDLLFALLEERSDEIVELFGPHAADPKDFEGQLKARFRRIHEYLHQHRGFFTIACDQGLLGPENASPDALRLPSRSARKQRFRDRLEAFIREGVAEGAIETDDPVLLTRFLSGALRGVMEGALRDHKRDLSLEGVRVLDLFLRAAAPRGAHAKRQRGASAEVSR
jgi:AcrR family transcriptional regulator